MTEEKLLQWHAAFFADIQIELEEEAEYKSPDDYLSIDDFFKVYGYACFYKADTGKVNEIKADELTITFACHGYPRELCDYLVRKLDRSISEAGEGIYYISDPVFPIQLIVQKRLSEEENLWLRSLTNDLSDRTNTEHLLTEYKKHERQNLYRSVMNIIVNANRERFEVNDMCEALDEILEFRFKGKLDGGKVWRRE